jgi:hypothetical protein
MVPEYHIQADVKFLRFMGEDEQRIKRFQYAAIGDAIRIRALRVYDKHTQRIAIDFTNYLIVTY